MKREPAFIENQRRLFKEIGCHDRAQQDGPGEWRVDGKPATPQQASKLSEYFGKNTVVAFA